MRATNIRNKDGSKLTESELETLCQVIVSQAAKAGFITGSSVLSGGAIKIGLHMSSFRVDTAKLGHNARINDYLKSLKGYKRTNVPTWDQRVEFNDLVNAIFNRWKLTARIVSGKFEVRSKADGARTESNWTDIDPSQGVQFNSMGQLMSQIMPEQEARDRCDSDRLEAEHKAATRDGRLAKARERRALIRAFESASKVRIAGVSDYDKVGLKNGMTVSHAVFARKLEKMNRWTGRRVREASIKATVTANQFGMLTLVPESELVSA
jgi:hypothetical protein